MLISEPGMKNGPILRMPPSWRATPVSSISGRPPIPEPIFTPTRVLSRSATSSRPASATACSAAAIPKWMNLSMRRASLGEMYWLMSKSLTSPATWQAMSLASKLVLVPMPLLPARRLAQAVVTSLPTGDTCPRPVTTTLRFDTGYLREKREHAPDSPETDKAALNQTRVSGPLQQKDLCGRAKATSRGPGNPG